MRLCSFLVLGACAAEPSTPLDQLATTYGDTTIEVVARGQLNIELHVDTTYGCPLLGSDVNAWFNGVRMNVTPGGYDETNDGCYPIAFWITPLPQTTMAAWEKTMNGSQLMVTDHSAQWTIGPTQLFATGLVDDPTTSRIIWQNVAEISTAQVVPPVPITIDGNTISYPPGTAISWVDAYAHPQPSRCSGPTSCVVDLEAIRSFDSINP